MPSDLQILYGLTPAEAQLALDLTASQTLKEIAERGCVSVATARTQLPWVFQKLGVSRQTELVRTLLSLSRPTRGGA